MKKKIFVIDDENTFLNYIKKILERTEKYEVFICNNALSAIKYIREIIPDVILLDIAMPEKSGSEIAAELKEDEKTKNIPVIFTTSLVSKKEAEENNYIIGGRYFLPKTSDLEEIEKSIKRVISIIR